MTNLERSEELNWKAPWIADLVHHSGGEKWFPLLQTAITSFFNSRPNYRNNPAAYALPYNWERPLGTPVNKDYVVDFNRKWDRDAREELALDVHRALTIKDGGGPLSLRYHKILARIDREEDFAIERIPGNKLRYWLYTSIENMLEKRRDGSNHQRLFDLIKGTLTGEPYIEMGILKTCGRSDDEIASEVGKQAFGIPGQSELRPLTRRTDLRIASERFRLIPRERPAVTDLERQRNSRIFKPDDLKEGIRAIIDDRRAAVSPGFLMQCAERAFPDLYPVVKSDQSWEDMIQLVGDLGETEEFEQMFESASDTFEDGNPANSSKSETSPFTSAVEIDELSAVGLDPFEKRFVGDAVDQILGELTDAEKICYANKFLGSAKNELIAERAGLEKTQYVSRRNESAQVKIRGAIARLSEALSTRINSDQSPASDPIEVSREVVRAIHIELERFMIEVN